MQRKLFNRFVRVISFTNSSCGWEGSRARAWPLAARTDAAASPAQPGTWGGCCTKQACGRCSAKCCSSGMVAGMRRIGAGTFGWPQETCSIELSRRLPAVDWRQSNRQWHAAPAWGAGTHCQRQPAGCRASVGSSPGVDATKGDAPNAASTGIRVCPSHKLLCTTRQERARDSCGATISTINRAYHATHS